MCDLPTSFYNPLINYTYQISLVMNGTLFTDTGDADVDSQHITAPLLFQHSHQKSEDSSLNMNQI